MMMLCAGEEGLARSVLPRVLGMTIKRSEKRLSKAAALYKIKEAHITKAKATHRWWTAPESLIALVNRKRTAFMRGLPPEQVGCMICLSNISCS